MNLKLVITTWFVLLGLNHIQAQRYQIDTVSTNLNGRVFAASFYKDRLVVCSDQKDRIYITVHDEFNNEPTDLYTIHPNFKDSTSKFDKMFRSLGHDGPASFDGSGTKIFLSRNQNSEKKTLLKAESNSLGLYFSQQDQQGNWNGLVPFEYNHPSYNITHPALNYEGDELIFASDMPGGYGGYDLWKSVYKNGSWSKPVNLGEGINTKNHELFPSVHGTILYFTSNRNEFGGLDIYQSQLTLGGYVTVVMPAPINSEFDDFSLISSNGFETGFFTSNRDQTDRIYSFQYFYPEFNDCDSIVETPLCYSLTEENAFEIGELGALEYYWNINGERIKGISIDYCFPGPGEYEITLDIEDTILKETYYEQNYYYLSIEEVEQPYINSPDTVLINEVFLLDASPSNLPEWEIRNDQYFWDFGDGKRRKGINTFHQFNQPGTFQVQLGVMGLRNGEAMKDCSFKTIVCIDPDSVFTVNETIPDNYLRTKPDDQNLKLYTIEVKRSKEELDTSDFQFRQIDPHHQNNLKCIKIDDEYVYVWGVFGDSIKASEYQMELVQLGYEESTLMTMGFSDVEHFQLDFYDEKTEKDTPPDLFKKPGGNVDFIASDRKYYKGKKEEEKLYTIQFYKSNDSTNRQDFIYQKLGGMVDYYLHYDSTEAQFVYLYGVFDSPKAAYDNWKELNQIGFEEAVVKPFSLNEISIFIPDSNVVVENLHFEFGEWYIPDTSFNDLHQIVELMNFYPGIKLEISAHTDNYGTEDYNMDLSNKRALAVKNYLVSQGIDPDRIETNGYGQNKPKETNETEEGRQVNRRVEFKFYN